MGIFADLKFTAVELLHTLRYTPMYALQDCNSTKIRTETPTQPYYAVECKHEGYWYTIVLLLLLHY